MSRMATDISVADHLPHGRGANIAILGNRGLALFCRYGLANSPDRWRISRGPESWLLKGERAFLRRPSFREAIRRSALDVR